jgi:hypothetical protein
MQRRLQLGDERGFLWSLEAVTEAWVALGQAEQAARALGFVVAHRQRLATVPVPFSLALTARRSAAAAAALGPARFQALWDEGFALDPAVVRGWFLD